MPNLRDLKRRIKSVDGIRQITRAMEMVAATKLRRAQQRIEDARPYTGKMDYILNRLSRVIMAGIVHHPLLEPTDDVRKVWIIGAASAKGLCGSFNSNLIRNIVSYYHSLSDDGIEVSLLPIGKKLHDFFRRRDYILHPSAADFTHIDEKIPVSLQQELTDICTTAFLAGDVDRVDMIYTEFKNAASYKITKRQFLPIVGLESPSEEEREEEAQDYIFEPDPGALFTILIPKYARMMIFRMLADSLASEHGARMNSMHNATDNAGDMIRTLTLKHNKARQAAITKELSEIVGGAEALKG